jgi:hypothetical protein
MKLLQDYFHIRESKSEFEYYGMDSIETYNTNLLKQPSDWEWRNKTISYKLNSQGYRCKEWNEYSWNDSVLILGCSIVFGEGVSHEQTLSEQLSSLIDKPVINLGFGGTGPMFHWINTVRLLEHVTPLAIIYVWPVANRCLEFVDADTITTKSLGIWNNRMTFGTPWIYHEYHGDCYREYAVKSCKLMAPCPVINYTHSSEHITDVTCLPTFIDSARDMIHPGPETFKLWTKIMKEDLCLP